MTRREWLAGALGAAQDPSIEALYRRAIVVDSLNVTDWDDAAFADLERSGYTAIHTSLANRNFAVGIEQLRPASALPPGGRRGARQARG